MYCQYMKTTKYYEYETFIIVYLFKGYSICKIHGRGHFFWDKSGSWSILACADFFV